MNYDASALTDGERVALWRYRRRVRLPVGRGGGALTQAQAAVALGLPKAAVARMENGARAEDVAEDAQQRARLAMELGTIVPTASERLRVVRLRWREAKLGGLAEVHRMLGVSRPHYLQLEATADPRLIAFWEGKGFTGLR